jgi:hypothetical protein
MKKKTRMTRQPVDSSNIKSVGYDAALETLEVEFLSGAIYQYQNVPARVHARLMRAESKGKFFNAHVKSNGAYPYRKMN